MEKFKIISIKNIDNLPTTAGVYAFYTKIRVSSDLTPIYIGKAVNIKNRVKNHFSSPTYKDSIYINQIENIGFIETGSEIQALILEANLIKKNQPKFNQVWRDDKNYFFIAIARNKDKIPYIFITHQPKQNLQPTSYKLQPKYIGPFVDGNALKKTIRFLRKVFPYYTASKHSKLKCTYCHLDLCPGPNPNLLEYKKNIKKLILVLEGKSSKVLNSLKKEMKLASSNQDFKEAIKLRDQIFALEKIMSHSEAHNTSKLSKKSWSQTSAKSNDWENIEKKLQNILNYNKPIKRIECYDVSNIQGKFATASMVVFNQGLAQKSEYKKFRIKMENKPNDIAMIKEVISRRLKHKDWQYPEIIIIDGGKAQLNAGIKVKNQTSEQFHRIVPMIISIAKGRKDPLRPQSEARLFIEDQQDPIPLKNLPQEIYNLIKNLDNEAHRFAITYHKKLRNKNIFM